MIVSKRSRRMMSHRGQHGTRRVPIANSRFMVLLSLPNFLLAACCRCGDAFMIPSSLQVRVGTFPAATHRRETDSRFLARRITMRSSSTVGEEVRVLWRLVWFKHPTIVYVESVVHLLSRKVVLPDISQHLALTSQRCPRFDSPGCLSFGE